MITHSSASFQEKIYTVGKNFCIVPEESLFVKSLKVHVKKDSNEELSMTKVNARIYNYNELPGSVLHTFIGEKKPYKDYDFMTVRTFGTGDSALSGLSQVRDFSIIETCEYYNNITIFGDFPEGSFLIEKERSIMVSAEVTENDTNDAHYVDFTLEFY